MSESVGTQVGKRSSSITFLTIVTVLSLALAGAELLLAVHYRRQQVAAETEKVAENFQKFYYDSYVWQKMKWLGITSEQTPTDNWSMQELTRSDPITLSKRGRLTEGRPCFMHPYCPTLIQMAR